MSVVFVECCWSLGLLYRIRGTWCSKTGSEDVESSTEVRRTIMVSLTEKSTAACGTLTTKMLLTGSLVTRLREQHLCSRRGIQLQSRECVILFVSCQAENLERASLHSLLTGQPRLAVNGYQSTQSLRAISGRVWISYLRAGCCNEPTRSRWPYRPVKTQRQVVKALRSNRWDQDRKRCPPLVVSMKVSGRINPLRVSPAGGRTATERLLHFSFYF